MNKKRPTPDPSAAKSGRKRTVPTIDLKATEVATEVASEAQPETAASDPAIQEAVQTSPAPESPASDLPAPDSPAPDAPGDEPPVENSVAEETVARASSESEPNQEPEPAFADVADRAANQEHNEKHNARGPGMTGAVLMAGVAGALVMSLVGAGLWFSGLLPVGDSNATMANARVTALETQVQDLLNRPAPVTGANAGDTKVLDALTSRVAKMEQSIAAIPANAPAADAALAKRLADAENAMKSLGVALPALSRRSDEIAANTAQARERADAAEKAVTELRASLQDVSKTASAGASEIDLTAQQERIAALEQTAKAVKDEIAKVAVTASAPDTTARLALTAAALRDAVLRGAPYNDELAQAKSLGGDEKVLAPIALFAASGVPGEKALAQELSALLPGMRKAAGAQKPSGSFLERLKDNASQLVRVRPLDAPPGDDTAAVLTRVEVAASRADIPAALADLGKLTEAQRAPAQAWIAKANNRQAALAASRQFAADAARSLGSR